MQSNTPHIGISLYDFTTGIRDIISDANLSAWVFGEVKNYKYSRHAYFSLIQSQEGTNTPIASLQCAVWGYCFDSVIGRFQDEAGVEMKDGLKVLVHLTVSFHQAYGMTATVDAIDASYTLGEYELKRKQTIAQLLSEGYMDLQQQLELPRVVRSIAIISANTAAGYGDFMDQLKANSITANCNCQLYPAIMQGVSAPESIVKALNSILSDLEEMVAEYDAVIIIRGGGSKQDLACFDDYTLATYIATFPLPIITGIGHEQDTSVADMVAYKRVKTPTAAAEFIIEHNSALYLLIDDLKRRLESQVTSIMYNFNSRISKQRQALAYIASGAVERQKTNVNTLRRNLHSLSDVAIQMERQRLNARRQQLEALDPQRIVNRGYTMTLSSSGSLISSIDDVKDGETITTLVRDGRLTSIVKK
ncbi:MAG: exodeoxyribonuclease VII large subunit [Bacteroidia bacterium]|nr:exodeoxyribonuclease VII large subunit [Bacteroidia bacterium]